MSGPITPDGRRVDPTPHLAAVASAMARPGQPAATYAALEAAMEAVLGHRLFTILRYHADSGESERVWTNRPAAYPVAGRKALNPTFWSRQVLHEHRPYLGRTAADLCGPRRPGVAVRLASISWHGPQVLIEWRRVRRGR